MVVFGQDLFSFMYEQDFSRLLLGKLEKKKKNKKIRIAPFPTTPNSVPLKGIFLLSLILLLLHAGWILTGKSREKKKNAVFCEKRALKSQQRPTGKVFVYKIQVNPIHTILKYGDYYDFMDR